jgi:ribosomal protein S12 methylthiotransferase
MAVQAEISAERLSEKVGRTLQVLVDEVDEEGVIARGPGDAPEIDGLVYLPPSEVLKPGDFVEVQVTHSDEHDLWGQPIK